MRRRLVLLIAAISVLGLGATALAQGGNDRSSVRVPNGCLTGTRVVVRIDPASDSTFTSLRIHAVGHEVVELTGVTSPASVTVRLPRHGGTVTVEGRTSDGRALSSRHTYSPCTPAATQPELEGGGES
jgi:hypothetical protein